MVIATYWNQSREVHSRFIGSISETLEEREEPKLELLLCHLATTGDCPATIKEWLVDDLRETVCLEYKPLRIGGMRYG